MQLIDLHGKVSTNASVKGAFNFLNVGSLVYELETTIEQVQQSLPQDLVRISCHLQHLDARCKRIVFDYLSRLEPYDNNCQEQKVLVEWKYDWFDDDIRQFGLFLGELLNIEFRHVLVCLVACSNHNWLYFVRCPR